MNAPIPPLAPMPKSNFRLFSLPAALCPNGQYSLAPLVRRNQSSSYISKLWVGRNFAFDGDAPDSFFELATIRAFAFHGLLDADLPATAPMISFTNPLPASIAENPLPLVTGIAIQLDGCDLVLPECFDFDSLANALLLFIGDEILSISNAAMTGAGGFELTAIRGRFGTAIADHAQGDDIFILPLADLTILQHPSFASGATALFKLTIGMQQLTDVASFTQQL